MTGKRCTDQASLTRISPVDFHGFNNGRITMIRIAWTLTLTLAAVAVLLLETGRAAADPVVVVYPRRVAYYYPPPVVSYYSPPVVYAPAPAVSYYGGPVSYYSPPVVYRPPVSYYAAPTAVTTTRYAFPRRPPFSTPPYAPSVARH